MKTMETAKTIRKTLLALGFLTLLSSCGNQAHTAKHEDEISVEVYQPTSHTADRISLSGQVSAQNAATITTRMMAFVERIYVKQGDRVRKGDLLIRLNAQDLNAKKAQIMAQITEAEAAAKNARRDYERFRKLHDLESVSDKELEQVELQKTSIEQKLTMARAVLREIEAQEAYTDLRAPFSGEVSRRMIDEGSMANPGMPLLTIEQSSALEVNCSISENYMAQIAVGDAVEIQINALQRSFRGHISELSSTAALSGGQYALKVAFDQTDPQLRSGMFASVQIASKQSAKDSDERVAIRKSSLIEREQLTGVYVVNADQKAVLRWVRLGKDLGDRVEVRSGLSLEEKVIDTPSGALYNGRSVSVVK